MSQNIAGAPSPTPGGGGFLDVYVPRTDQGDGGTNPANEFAVAAIKGRLFRPTGSRMAPSRRHAGFVLAATGDQFAVDMLAGEICTTPASPRGEDVTRQK